MLGKNILDICKNALAKVQDIEDISVYHSFNWCMSYMFEAQNAWNDQENIKHQVTNKSQNQTTTRLSCFFLYTVLKFIHNLDLRWDVTVFF